MLVAQKQRVDWVTFGDRNSAWFHNWWRTKSEREIICGLRIGENKWCNDHHSLREKAGQFFQGIYDKEDTHNQAHNIRGMFPKVPDRKLQDLLKPVDLEEVRDAVYDIGPLKAPSPVGYNAQFFQKKIGIQLEGMYTNL